MVTRSKRRASTSKDECETEKKKVCIAEEDISSEAENDNYKKHKKSKQSKQRKAVANDWSNNKRKKTKANEESVSDESSAESSIDEFTPNVAKRTKTSHSKDKQNSIRKSGAGGSHYFTKNKGKPKYLIKWKDDGSQIWESYQRANSICPDILRKYIAEAKIRDEVEAIISHHEERAHIKYLIKWKDDSRGETWETPKAALAVCPKMVKDYHKKLAEEKAKANEVEAILSHEKDEYGSKYLIRWKDPSKGESWERARKAYAVCPELVNKFHEIPKTKLLVEDIVSHRLYKSHYRYLIKWKDNVIEQSWENYKTVQAICPNILQKYVAEVKSRNKVEAILSHRKQNNKVKYLIKWKDRSRGETWETHAVASKICPKMFKAYNRKVNEEKAEAEAKANEVEAIISHKLDKDESKYLMKYLIKWKDHSRGETWETAKRTKAIYPDILNKFMEKLNETGEELTVEAIIAHKHIKGKLQYLIKWKDEAGTKSWESYQKASSACPNIFHDYIAHIGDEVEAIISHRREKTGALKYLIKWKDHSKGETWERTRKATDICPQLLKEYNKNVEETIAEANEVEDIISHKIKRGRSRYLIRWKDHSKGETWETAVRTIDLCRNGDILDKFKKKNPQCVHYVPKNSTGIQKKKTKKVQVKVKPKSTKQRSSARHNGKQRVIYLDADDE